MTTECEAVRQAEDLMDYWKAQGHPNVRFTPVRKKLPRGALVWTIESNLINGLPPKPVKGKVVEFPTIEQTSYFDELMAKVCLEHGVTKAQMLSKRATKKLAAAKRQFCDEADREGYSSVSIGAYLRKDHTTILHHLKKAREEQ